MFYPYDWFRIFYVMLIHFGYQQERPGMSESKQKD